MSIIVEGLRNARGTLLVCVTANPAAFPDCSRDPRAVRLQLPASASPAPIRVDIGHGGTYAVAIVHDENGNGRLDTMMMMPREGFGFSRNPALRLGPPRFADASFAVAAATPISQRVRMRYML